MTPAVGWTVLGLVFLDELLAVAALGVWGWSSSPRLVLVWLLPLAGVAVWSLFASPKARHGSAVARPVAKALVFGVASLGLVLSGHPVLALLLVVFSVLVNALAMVPSVRGLAAQTTS